MEPVTGIEPVTCCLRNSCSTTELHWRFPPGWGRATEVSAKRGGGKRVFRREGFRGFSFRQGVFVRL